MALIVVTQIKKAILQRVAFLIWQYYGYINCFRSRI